MTRRWRQRVLYFAAENPLLILLVIAVVVIQIITGSMLAPANLRSIGLEAATVAIVSAPVAMLIISGYIDFSVGSILALGGVSGALVVKSGADPGTAILVAVLVGALIGVINGTLTIIIGFSSFVTTLGMLVAIRGVAQLLAPLPVSGFPDSFLFLGIGTLAGVPLIIWVAVGLLVLSAVFLARTPAGRHVYAIGVNREAAYLSGVKVRTIPFLLYVYSGASAGLAGAITVARLNSSPAGQIGQGFELTVITAVLLGGVALTGGAGTIFGVAVGVLFLGVLRNALVLFDVPTFWQNVASGVALIVAIGLALLTERLRAQLIQRDSMGSTAGTETDSANPRQQNDQNDKEIAT